MPPLSKTKRELFGPILCYGFGATVAMWIIGFVTHHPAISVPPMVAGILLIFTLLTACIFAGGSVERRRSWKVGLGTGIVSALLNMLVLGSYMVQKDEHGRIAYSLIATEAGGFILLGALVGLAGGITGTILETIFSARRKELIVPFGEPDWLARFAIVAAGAAFPLLILGGLTTSSGSALSVPDWPGTYGANMFLYPIGLMTRPRVFIEHSHRLFGSLVGLTTFTLMIMTFVAHESRRWVRLWAVALFVIVCVQGYLGGIRVTEKSTLLALLHGVLAQIFFALLVAYAAIVSPMFKSADYPRGVVTARRPKTMATALLHTTIVQLIFGAMYRHYGSPHAMYTHIAFSLIVVVFAIFAGMEIRTMLAQQMDARWARPQRSMGIVGAAILLCVGLQFALGWAALLVVGIKKGKPALPEGEAAVLLAEKSWAEQLIPTIHQANGALLLGLATLGYVWVWRLWRRGGGAAPA
jgi:cytochrome c oxidase assembly protein subunit 15